MQDGLLFKRSTRQLCKQDITICVCTWIVPYVRICMRFITVKNVDVVLLAWSTEGGLETSSGIQLLLGKSKVPFLNSV